MSGDKLSVQKSVNEFSEWQDGQFNPGHNLDDKVPSYVLYSDSPRWIGLLLIGLSAISAISEYFLIRMLLFAPSPLSFWQLAMNTLLILVMTGLEIFLIVEGVRKIRSKRIKPNG